MVGGLDQIRQVVLLAGRCYASTGAATWRSEATPQPPRRRRMVPRKRGRPVQRSAESAFCTVDERWLVAKFAASRSGKPDDDGVDDLDASAAKRPRAMPVAAFVQDSLAKAERVASELRDRVRQTPAPRTQSSAHHVRPLCSQAVHAAHRITFGAIAEARRITSGAMTEAAEEQARIDLAAEQHRQRLLSEAQLAAAEIRRNAEAEAEQTRKKAEEEARQLRSSSGPLPGASTSLAIAPSTDAPAIAPPPLLKYFSASMSSGSVGKPGEGASEGAKDTPGTTQITPSPSFVFGAGSAPSPAAAPPAAAPIVFGSTASLAPSGSSSGLLGLAGVPSALGSSASLAGTDASASFVLGSAPTLERGGSERRYRRARRPGR